MLASSVLQLYSWPKETLHLCVVKPCSNFIWSCSVIPYKIVLKFSHNDKARVFQNVVQYSRNLENTISGFQIKHYYQKMKNNNFSTLNKLSMNRFCHFIFEKVWLMFQIFLSVGEKEENQTYMLSYFRGKMVCRTNGYFSKGYSHTCTSAP